MQKTLLLILLLCLNCAIQMQAQDQYQEVNDQVEKALDDNKIPMTDSRMLDLAKNMERQDDNALANFLRAKYYLKNEYLPELKGMIFILYSSHQEANCRNYYFEIQSEYIDYLTHHARYDLALEELGSYKSLALRYNDSKRLATCFSKLGNIYYEQGDFENALDHFFMNEDFCKEKDLDFEFYTLYNSMGECFAALNFETPAIDYFNKALIHSNNDRDIELPIYLNILSVYLNAKDTTSSEQYIDLIRANWSFDSITGKTRNNYYKIASQYNLMIGNKERALTYVDSITNRGRHYMEKQKLYAALGDTAKAYCYSLIHAEYVSTQLNQNNNELLAKYAAQSENERLNNERQKLKMDKLLLSIWFVVFAVIMLLSVFYHYMRNKQQVEAKLRAEKEKAEKAEQLKSLFLQNMSHEIRTPLNAIVGFSDVLNGETRDHLTEEQKKECLSIIQSNSDLLITLINDILDISKFESGTYRLNISQVDIHELCTVILESVQMKVSSNVKLVMDADPNAALLSTDAQRLKQVLINYLVNACTHTQKGSITLSYKVKHDRIEFAVTDTGTGVPLENIDTVFRRFEMASNNEKGIGLGLHICQLIATLLKGKVYIDKTYTQGARFVFEHPI